MASSLGQAFLAIVPKLDSSAMTSACDSINTGLSKVGEVGEKAFKAVEAAAAAGVAALAGVTTAAVSEYSAFEQNIGGVQKLFGDAADTVAQNAANAYKTAGMSANQYMEQATSFSAALINSLGGDTEAAAQQADVAMRAMSDNVNTFGSDMTDVQNAFQGFAKQNYTMLDNLKLGYGGTKEEMERLISDANALAEANGEAADLSIDSFSDIVTAIELVQEKQNIAGTTAREAATTLEGSLNMLKASWTNWLTELGKDDADMGALTEQLVESFETAASNAIPRIETIVGRLAGEVPGLFADVAPQLAQFLDDALTSLASQLTNATGLDFTWIFNKLKLNASDAVSAVVEDFDGMGELLQESLGQLQTPFAKTFTELVFAAKEALEGVSEVFSSLTAALSDGFVTALAEDVLPAMDNWLESLEPLIEPLTTLGTLVGDVLATALTAVGEILALALDQLATFNEVFTPILNTLLEGITPALESILGAVNTVLPQIRDIIDAALSAAQAKWNEVWPVLQPVVEAIMNGVSSVVSNAMSLVQSVITTILAAINGDWDGVWNGLHAVVTNAWNLVTSVVSSGIDVLLSFFTDLPGQIVSAIGNVGSLLYNAGSSIIDGLMNGIKDTISGVFSFVSGIADTIASLKGPLPYDRKVLIPNGMALMESLESGLRKGFPAVENLVSGMADTLASDMSVSPTLESKGSVYGTVTVAGAKQADTGILSKLESIAAKLEERETAVYVDGKKLASTIAKPMNQQLGRLAARGV